MASSARRALEGDQKTQAKSIKPGLMSLLEAAKGTGMMKAVELKAKESLEEKSPNGWKQLSPEKNKDTITDVVAGLYDKKEDTHARNSKRNGKHKTSSRRHQHDWPGRKKKKGQWKRLFRSVWKILKQTGYDPEVQVWIGFGGGKKSHRRQRQRKGGLEFRRS